MTLYVALAYTERIQSLATNGEQKSVGHHIVHYKHHFHGRFPGKLGLTPLKTLPNRLVGYGFKWSKPKFTWKTAMKMVFVMND